MTSRRYPYSHLNATTNEIRLLSLTPGSQNDPIKCWIQHVSLRTEIDFIALSYTWGDPSNPQPITVNEQYALNVTVNLRDALLRLRQENERQLFWIDAICINQEDIEERNTQVPRMRDIYAQASAVQVWLGKASNLDLQALALVQSIGKLVPDPEVFLSKGGDAQINERFWTLFEESSPELIKALNDLFLRPWWTRVWVVQELSVAKQFSARVTCGDATVSWHDLLVCAYAIEGCWTSLNEILWQKFPEDALDGFNNGRRMAQCRHVDDNWPRYHLLELLHQHRDCEATDPRDHIYGLLGMSGDAGEIGLVPNYKQSAQDIYRDLVMKYISATKSLDIICACRQERKFVDLPTWVPDWSTDQVIPGICINERYCGGDTFAGSPISHFERYKTAGSSYADVSFTPSAAELITKGFKFGTIVTLSPIDDGMTFEDVEAFGRSGPDGKSRSGSETFDAWLNLILDDKNYELLEQRYGVELLDAFCRTLVGNRNNRMMKPKAEENSDEDMDEDTDKIGEVDGDWEEDEELASTDGDYEGMDEDNADQIFSPVDMLNMSLGEFKSCIQVSWGKRLAVLDTGYLGIVPGHCERGDSAYVLWGNSLPITLRTKDSAESILPAIQNFILIGESYFHGVSEGELVGQLGQNDNGTETIVLI